MIGKCPAIFILCVLVTVWSVSGWVYATETSPPDAVFVEAATAYDAGDYAAAIALYERLHAEGWQVAELYYNLGNAYYRQGKPGLAVLHFKRALALAPRNAHARHNLEFVLRAADAVQPTQMGWARLLRRLRLSEWVMLAVIAWWMLMWQWVRRIWFDKPFWGGWLLPAWMVAGLLALAGILLHVDLQQRPEYVITTPGQEALFAPLDSATAHFTLPEGSIVRIVDYANGWYRIRLDQKEGWIRHAAGLPVGTLLYDAGTGDR